MVSRRERPLPDFIHQKTFSDCKNPKTGRHLKFDFFLPQYNICIEYDGEQHHKARKAFGGEKALKQTIYRDKIKDDYCAKQGIMMVRIKHTQNLKAF